MLCDSSPVVAWCSLPKILTRYFREKRNRTRLSAGASDQAFCLSCRMSPNFFWRVYQDRDKKHSCILLLFFVPKLETELGILFAVVFRPTMEAVF